MQAEPFRRRSLGLQRVCLTLLISLGAGSTYAATYCIKTGDVGALSAAMLTASSNGGSDTIKLQAGYYSVPMNFLLSYSPTAADQGGDLLIAGGYGPTIGDDCGLAPTVADASVTILEGGRWRTLLSSAGGSITLNALTLQSTFTSDPAHAAIELGAEANANGSIVVDNVMFIDNSSLASSAISVMADIGSVSVRNSLFASTVALGNASPVRIGSLRNGSFCALIVNSTFAATAAAAPALQVSTPDCPAVVANDIFWNNAPGGGVVFDAPDNAYLFSNDIEASAEAAGTHVTDLYSVDPQFNPDFSLSDLSALRDKGNEGTAVFSPGTFDVVGQPRIYHGELPDIGAFEIQDVIFAFDFDPGRDPL
ncbi:MAG TPA: hypothetical protein VJ696_05610 [Rhodanobacteraceae bacterium]|nr:hypothetical protein [Rhodanobacteraceae bacterium]